MAPKPEIITLKGEVFTGVLRGKPLIEKYHPRLIGILGFEPFKGTLDIKLEKKFDIKPYSEKRLEHVLQSGHKMVYAYFAKVKMHVKKIKNSSYECWAMRQSNGVYGDDVIEIVNCECFREKYDLEDNDQVEITFFLKPVKKKKRSIKGLTKLKKKIARKK